MPYQGTDRGADQGLDPGLVEGAVVGLDPGVDQGLDPGLVQAQAGRSSAAGPTTAAARLELRGGKGFGSPETDSRVREYWRGSHDGLLL